MSSAAEHRAAVTASAPRNSDRITDAYALRNGWTDSAAGELAGFTRGLRATMAQLQGEARTWSALIETGTLSGYSLGFAQGRLESARQAASMIREHLALVVTP